MQLGQDRACYAQLNTADGRTEQQGLADVTPSPARPGNILTRTTDQQALRYARAGPDAKQKDPVRLWGSVEGEGPYRLTCGCGIHVRIVGLQYSYRYMQWRPLFWFLRNLFASLCADQSLLPFFRQIP